MADNWRTFGITIIVLIILTLLVYAFIYVSRECNTNLDCSSDEYCAFNHKCYPKQEIIKQTTSTSSLIFLITIAGIIILAYLYYKTIKK